MHHIAKILPMLLLLALLQSCEPSKFPIAPSTLKTDTRLLGKWTDGDKKGAGYYTVKQGSDAYHYNILLTMSKDKPEVYPAYLSRIDKSLFLNIYGKDGDKAGFFFVRILDIDATGNTIKVAGISDTTFQYMTSTAQVREHIVQHMDDPKFYTDTSLFHRIK